jgi:hypothetical protein
MNMLSSGAQALQVFLEQFRPGSAVLSRWNLH